MRDGTLRCSDAQAFVSFLCSSFFFSVLLLLLLLLRVIVASCALGKRRSRFSNSLVTQPVESERRRRRREKENERKREFRWVHAFLSLFSLSLSLCPQQRFDCGSSSSSFQPRGKRKSWCLTLTLTDTLFHNLRFRATCYINLKQTKILALKKLVETKSGVKPAEQRILCRGSRDF